MVDQKVDLVCKIQQKAIKTGDKSLNKMGLPAFPLGGGPRGGGFRGTE